MSNVQLRIPNANKCVFIIKLIFFFIFYSGPNTVLLEELTAIQDESLEYQRFKDLMAAIMLILQLLRVKRTIYRIVIGLLEDGCQCRIQSRMSGLKRQQW
jgi:hypothetical protein